MHRIHQRLFQRPARYKPGLRFPGRAALVVAGFLFFSAAFAAEPRIGDPMRPAVQASGTGVDGSASRDVALTAVLISPTRRIAVINGHLYREGDEVAGARITRIEARSVRLTRDGESRIVSLDGLQAPESTTDGDSSR